MILTMPLLMFLWVSSAITLLFTLVFLFNRRFKCFGVAYFITGFLHLAVPFKLATPATSLFGMFFLSVVWPVWDGQIVLGYHLSQILPTWFQALLFNL